MQLVVDRYMLLYRYLQPVIFKICIIICYNYTIKINMRYTYYASDKTAEKKRAIMQCFFLVKPIPGLLRASWLSASGRLYSNSCGPPRGRRSRADTADGTRCSLQNHRRPPPLPQRTAKTKQITDHVTSAPIPFHQNHHMRVSYCRRLCST